MTDTTTAELKERGYSLLDTSLPKNTSWPRIYEMMEACLRDCLAKLEELEQEAVCRQADRYALAIACVNKEEAEKQHARAERLKAKIEELERDHARIIGAVLRCSPMSACERDDNRLEPPWEVIDRIRKEHNALREENAKLKEEIAKRDARDGKPCIAWAKQLYHDMNEVPAIETCGEWEAAVSQVIDSEADQRCTKLKAELAEAQKQAQSCETARKAAVDALDEERDICCCETLLNQVREKDAEIERLKSDLGTEKLNGECINELRIDLHRRFGDQVDVAYFDDVVHNALVLRGREVLDEVVDGIAPSNRHTDYGKFARSSSKALVALIKEQEALAVSEALAEQREKVFALVKEYYRAYPADVFPQPPKGQHGSTVDQCSAAALRAILPNLLRDLHAALEPGRQDE